jgi:hypothetical protein
MLSSSLKIATEMSLFRALYCPFDYRILGTDQPDKTSSKPRVSSLRLTQLTCYHYGWGFPCAPLRERPCKARGAAVTGVLPSLGSGGGGGGMICIGQVTGNGTKQQSYE